MPLTYTSPKFFISLFIVKLSCVGNIPVFSASIKVVKQELQ